MKTYEDIYDEHDGNVAKIAEAMQAEVNASGVGFNSMHLITAEISGLKYAVQELQAQLVNVGVAAEVLPEGYDESMRALNEGFGFAMQRGVYDVAFATWQQQALIKPPSGLVVPK